LVEVGLDRRVVRLQRISSFRAKCIAAGRHHFSQRRRSKSEIDAYVHDRLGRTQAGAEIQRARDNLTLPAARKDASPSFLDVYAASLASEIGAQRLEKEQTYVLG